MTRAPQPLFIDRGGNALFAVYYPPAGNGDQCWLCVPPFGEEMNRSRPMVTAQARVLAQLNVATLVIDLYGTGDSDGELVDAGWDDWRQDIHAALDWLTERGLRCAGLWAIRLGMLLALDALGRHPDPPSRLLAWQPVSDGKQFLTQLLRLRLAAEMMHSSGKQSAAELRRRLAAGETLEVAGYPLNPRLAAELEQLSVTRLDPSPLARLDWLEVSAREPPALSVASNRVLEQLRQTTPALQVHALAVPGETFWSLYERSMAPELIAATGAAVSV